MAAAVLLSACTSGSGTNTAGSQPPVAPASTAGSQSAPVTDPSSSVPPAPVKVSTTPTVRTDVNPTTPVTVTAANGTLRAVKLFNPEGKLVSGAFSADHKSWHTTEVLGYSKTYRLSARASGAAGESVDRIKRKFTTLTPSNMTLPYLNTLYGIPIQNHGIYGVGMVPVVHFDEPITDQKAAEKALHVTTSPHVDGSWYWADSQDVHWRPRHYYQPGTTVTVDAKVYGVQVGHGLYGESDEQVSYKIGAKHVAIANAKTHQVRVYFNGNFQRSMPTSMGQGGVVQGKNGPIYLWTMPGTYTVIGHENPAIMSSDSYGLPANSPLGYAPEKVYWSTKISTDGIYLHELDATVWAQGHENLSHGCLNLNETNAKWYFNTSRVGDIVKVIHSGGPKLQLWQGGDWTLTWKQWKKGSALS
jgi:lipoprotein-anchoring transpeptidase ErfK/SrfK